jgi:hypothetical protein
VGVRRAKRLESSKPNTTPKGRAESLSRCLGLQRLLAEFVAQIQPNQEGSPAANELHRRVGVAFDLGEFGFREADA